MEFEEFWEPTTRTRVGDCRGELLDGGLAVGGGVADVFLGGGFDAGVFGFEGGDDGFGIVEGESGLREVGDFVVGGDFELLDVGGVFDDFDVVGSFAEGADDFVVVLVADEDDGVFLLGVTDGFVMDFGDEGAGGIDLDEVAVVGFFADFR